MLVVGNDISKGTFGKVSYCIYNGKECVVKRSNGKKSEPSFLNEVRILKYFKNTENVIQVIDSFSRNNLSIIVLENGGMDLLSFLTENIIEENEKISFTRQIVNGVDAIHDKNISHRDLKLENILTDGYKIKICDFGLAIKISETGSVRPSKMIGSMIYMSPELHNRKTYDTYSADVWATGIIIFSIFCNCFPFKDSSSTICKQIMLFENFTDGVQNMYSSIKVTNDNIKKILNDTLTFEYKRISIKNVKNTLCGNV